MKTDKTRWPMRVGVAPGGCIALGWLGTGVLRLAARGVVGFAVWWLGAAGVCRAQPQPWTQVPIPAQYQNLILQIAFTETLVSGQPLVQPAVTNLDGLKAQLEGMLVNADTFTNAYRDLVVGAAMSSPVTYGITRERLRLPFTLGRDLDAYAYVRRSTNNPAGAARMAVLVIPGSGADQSSLVAGADSTHPYNYHKNIAEVTSAIGDTFILVKPNEDFLAIHNGTKKLNGYFVYTGLIDQGGSYSALYLTQALALAKYLKQNYDGLAIVGLSQGGTATLLVALQATPTAAVVSSGYSILQDKVNAAGVEQILLPKISLSFGAARMRQLMEGNPTRYLFTWGRYDGDYYKIEAELGLTAGYFSAVPQVQALTHYDSHRFPMREVTEFLGSHLSRLRQGTPGGPPRTDPVSATRTEWRSLSQPAGWSPRASSGRVVFNNQMWVFGGGMSAGGVTVRTNDVWSSADGVTWSLAAAQPPWAARSLMASVVFQNRIWLLGGTDGTTTFNDVWSSGDGTNWVAELASAPWSARSGAGCVVLQNQLLLLGGSDANGAANNEVWSSADGRVWTRVLANAPWAARGTFGCVAHRERVWVFGGGPAGQNLNYHDVWSSTNGVAWDLISTAAPWSPRRSISTVVWDDKMWLLGGYSAAEGVFSDVWFSENGRDWQPDFLTRVGSRHEPMTLVFQNRIWTMGGGTAGQFLNGVEIRSNESFAAPAVPSRAPEYGWDNPAYVPHWSPRDTPGSVVFNGRLWVLGGVPAGGARKQDVWSTADGETWSQDLAVAPWAGRNEPGVVSLGGRMWLMGGYNGTAFNDVWSSAEGTNWVLETASAGWSRRYGAGHAVVNGKMWVLGGRGAAAGSANNEVWSSTDGRNWTLVLGSAPWAARYEYGCVAFGERLWVMGGVLNDGSITNDVWSSADGVTWVPERDRAPWPARALFGCVATTDKLWVIGGYAGSISGTNDVWYSTDGRIWRQDTETIPWDTRFAAAATAFAGRIWLLGGYGFNVGAGQTGSLDDIWFRGASVRGTELSGPPPSWAVATYSAPWTPRDSAGSVVFNNRLWIIGGVYTSGRAADAWFTADGTNWIQSIAQAPWGGRNLHGVASFAGRLWVLGGYDGVTARNDVWSSGDGTNWVQETASAGWSGRFGAGHAIFNGKLWVLGGRDGAAGTANGEVWSSADGRTWSQEVVAAPWGARSQFGCAVFASRLWVLGGEANSGTFSNDVWSSGDGVTWVQETTHAAWAERMLLGCVATADKLWVFGGYLGAQGPTSDAWWSADGRTWQMDSLVAPWSVRAAPAATEFQGRIWLLGGNGSRPGEESSGTLNDVWVRGANPVVVAAPAWSLATSSAGWSGRDTAESVVFNNRLWVLGGVATNGFRKADVWSSPDGTNWSQAVAVAPWPARNEPGLLSFSGRLWLMGGYTGSAAQNDVWSSADGTNWVQELTAAAWSGRFGAGHVVFGGKLWVLGGRGRTAGTANSEVWNSTDGRTWSLQATAPWAARSQFGCTVFGGRLWVVGGELNGGVLANDVWSSTDGSAWVLEKDHAAWANRALPGCVTTGDGMWLLGGYVGGPWGPTAWTNDVWFSADGRDWQRDLLTVPWTARLGMLAKVFQERLWLMGGFGTISAPSRGPRNDVWWRSLPYTNTLPAGVLVSQVQVVEGATLVVTSRTPGLNPARSTVAHEFLVAPAGATVNQADGTVTWPTGVGQGGNVFLIITKASYPLYPACSVTNQFLVTVTKPVQSQSPSQSQLQFRRERPAAITLQPGPLLVRAPASLTASEVLVTFSVHAGGTYLIEVSDDLGRWIPIQTNKAGSGTLIVRDPVAVDRRSRFYRATEIALP